MPEWIRDNEDDEYGVWEVFDEDLAVNEEGTEGKRSE